jgi:predicted amino acid dehydrogenase
MDHQSSSLKFGAIGHQENWQKVSRFVKAVRDLKSMKELTIGQIKEIFGFIPPRTMFEVNMHSSMSGVYNGVYIETFISPDELDANHLRVNLNKVLGACQYAASLNIPIVSLGGFTSIVLESSGYNVERIGNTSFTTGNTLTAGFIVKGIEKACVHWNQPLEKSSVMIIGSTGDIGSACTRYLARKAKQLILCARQKGPLEQQAISLLANKVNVDWSTDINKFLGKADIVVCVASSILEKCNMSLLPAHTIICDAGYPKNLYNTLSHSNHRIFFGGMGIVKHGYNFHPVYADEIYRFPIPNIVHGCLLEGIVLAMNGTPGPLSTGRGNITVPSMERIVRIAASHGIHPAPLFNSSLIRDNQIHDHERKS